MNDCFLFEVVKLRAHYALDNKFLFESIFPKSLLISVKASIPITSKILSDTVNLFNCVIVKFSVNYAC